MIPVSKIQITCFGCQLGCTIAQLMQCNDKNSANGSIQGTDAIDVVIFGGQRSSLKGKTWQFLGLSFQQFVTFDKFEYWQ